jgi:NADH pyrophosphatase NudC (nudix superfamily)
MADSHYLAALHIRRPVEHSPHCGTDMLNWEEEDRYCSRLVAVENRDYWNIPTFPNLCPGVVVDSTKKTYLQRR